MEILAISGSSRGGSYNSALLSAFAKLAPKHVNITVFDQLKQIPVFEPATSDKNLPESVNYFISRIRESDGIIISTPEYAHGITGVLKNALDWLVASDALVLKPVVVTSVSTSGLGGVRAHSALVLILAAMNVNIVIEGSLNVPYAQRKFDENLTLTDSLTPKAIQVSLLALEQAIKNA